MVDKTKVDSEKLKTILQVHKTNTAKRFVKEIDKNPELRQKIVIVFGMGSWIRDPQSKSHDWDVVCIWDDSGEDITKTPIAYITQYLASLLQQIAWKVDQRFHIQCYPLTSLIDGVLQAFPIMYSYIRDGVPFKDEKGLFVTLKRLVQMQRVKPTEETIKLQQQGAREKINKVKEQIKSDLFFDLQYAAADISQAIVAAAGYEIPDPVRIEKVLKELKSQGIIEQKYVDVWVDIYKKWKCLEHGECTGLSPQEFGEYAKKTKDYIDYIESKIPQARLLKQKQEALKYIDLIKTQIKEILNLTDVDYTDKNSVEVFEKEFVNKGLVSPQTIGILKQLEKIKDAFDKNQNMSEAEINTTFGLINFVTNEIYILKEHLKAKTIESVPHITLLNPKGEIIEKTWFLKKDLIVSKKENEYLVAPLSKPEDSALKPIKGKNLLKKIEETTESKILKDVLIKRIKGAKNVNRIVFVAKNSVIVDISEIIK